MTHEITFRFDERDGQMSLTEVLHPAGLTAEQLNEAAKIVCEQAHQYGPHLDRMPATAA